MRKHKEWGCRVHNCPECDKRMDEDLKELEAILKSGQWVPAPFSGAK